MWSISRSSIVKSTVGLLNIWPAWPTFTLQGNLCNSELPWNPENSIFMGISTFIGNSILSWNLWLNWKGLSVEGLQLAFDSNESNERINCGLWRPELKESKFWLSFTKPMDWFWNPWKFIDFKTLGGQARQCLGISILSELHMCSIIWLVIIRWAMLFQWMPSETRMWSLLARMWCKSRTLILFRTIIWWA